MLKYLAKYEKVHSIKVLRHIQMTWQLLCDISVIYFNSSVHGCAGSDVCNCAVTGSVTIQ